MREGESQDARARLDERDRPATPWTRHVLGVKEVDLTFTAPTRRSARVVPCEAREGTTESSERALRVSSVRAFALMLVATTWFRNTAKVVRAICFAVVNEAVSVNTLGVTTPSMTVA